MKLIMRYSGKWQLVVVCLLALALLPFAPARRGTAQAPGYTVTDLGTLGGSAGLATALNQGGTVVGSALTSGSLLHPFVRPAAGPMQDIGTLGGFSAEAHDINAAGQVVGQTEDGSFQDRAFVWPSGAGMQALPAPWGTPIRAYGINDAGQIAG